MKKFLLLFGLSFLFVGATPAYANTLTCNKACQVNEDCGSGYRCYVGICRAAVCPSSPDCACAIPQATPTSATRATVATPTPSPSPKATPMVLKKITTAPKTGASDVLPLLGVVSLGLCGLVLKRVAGE